MKTIYKCDLCNTIITLETDSHHHSPSTKCLCGEIMTSIWSK